MKRIIFNGAFIIVLILITLLGLGPAIYTEGTNEERLYTLLTIGFLYLLIFIMMYYFNKRVKK